MKHITRFAPSPTGVAHLGNFRTAYFNWLMARASGGKFILRIDDTDANRNDSAAVNVIFRSLDWLGLDYDDVYFQSKRNDLYHDIADKMIMKDYAKIDSDSIAIKLDSVFVPSYWVDTIAGKIFTSDKDRDNTKDLVIVKSDGSPTYNFATAVDDLDMGITDVIRGTDHIANTIKQLTVMVAGQNVSDKLSNADIPTYTHVGLIMKDKKKLSKRDNAASLLDYKDAGYSPDAMLNFMLRLGWAPSDPNFDKHTKLITKKDAVDLFLTAGKMRSAPANMDMSKLDWYNRRYKTG